MFPMSSPFNDTDMLNIPKAQASTALPKFLDDPAESQCRTSPSVLSRHGSMTCSLEVITHLLRTYATSGVMHEVLENHSHIRKGQKELWERYGKRLNEAFSRCGNVQREDEKITLYIDGLSDTIQAVAARYRESVHHHGMNFESFVSFSRSEDETYSAWARQISQVRVFLRATGKTNHSLPRPQIQERRKRLSPDSTFSRPPMKRFGICIRHCCR